jgi:peptidylprolyl isomerase
MSRPRITLAVALALGAACTTEKPPADAAAASGAAPGATAGAPAGANPDPAQNTYAPALGVNLAAFYKTPRGAYYQDVQVGTGTVAIPGRKAKVRYAGYLANGKRFDAGEYTFTIGGGEVIAGWDEGIAGMKVGGKRKLVLPAVLGYGSTGSPPDIPPYSVLVFDTELLEVS